MKSPTSLTGHDYPYVTPEAWNGSVPCSYRVKLSPSDPVQIVYCDNEARALQMALEALGQNVCPGCRHPMKLERDTIAGDYYCQCRNPRCNEDGFIL
jgi:hypothetical protein